MSLQDSIFNRYGIRTPIPPRLEGYPEPASLYGVPAADDTTDYVQEHGEWCARRCVFPENEARIRELMD